MYIGLKIHTLKHICIIPFLEKQPSSFFFFLTLSNSAKTKVENSVTRTGILTSNAFLLGAGLVHLLGT